MSKLTDYGTLVMAHLAGQPQAVVKAREISDQTGVALPTVSKILKMLARDQLVDSFQGAQGGYQLARASDDISMAQIISALEGGPIGLTECSTDPGACEQESNCTVRANWQKINQVITDALDSVSLAEISMQPNAPEVTLRSIQNGQV